MRETIAKASASVEAENARKLKAAEEAFWRRKKPPRRPAPRRRRRRRDRPARNPGPAVAARGALAS